MKSILCEIPRASAMAACLTMVCSGFGPVLRAGPVAAWNEAMTAAVPGDPVRPLHLEARVRALAHAAMAAAGGDIDSGDAEFDRIARGAAMATAARDALAALVPDFRARFDALAGRQIAALPAGPARVRGEALGALAAERVLRARVDDGWSDVAAAESVPAARPARGAASRPSPWLRVRPFALKTAGQVEVAELRNVRNDGSIHADFTLQSTALFDGVDPVAAERARAGLWSQSPLRAWNQVARAAGEAGNLDLLAEARLFAALNAALADAVIAALHARHVVGSWRSVTTEVWRPVAEWQALGSDALANVDDGARFEHVRREKGQTLIPPVAHYPSVAATLAGAAQAVLEHGLRLPPGGFALPETGGARVFPGFAAAAREQVFVASLDGVHTRESCVAGHRLGREIGRLAGRRAPRF